MEVEKDLKPVQYEVLLKTLKNRFEKNMDRHKDLEWAEIQARLEGDPQKLRSLREMESTGVNRMLLARTETQGNLFSVIVLPRARMAEEASVTTTRHLSQGKNTNPEIARLKWLRQWA
jgi:hypothetical protein